MSTFFLEWGGDLQLNQRGGLQLATGWDEARQRIERRLLTNAAGKAEDGTPIPADYIFDDEYGIGLPRLVGDLTTGTWNDDLQQKVIQGVSEDASVDSSIPPTIALQSTGTHQTFLYIGVILSNQQPGTIVLQMD
jgi:hypothetical protein